MLFYVFYCFYWGISALSAFTLYFLFSVSHSHLLSSHRQFHQSVTSLSL